MAINGGMMTSATQEWTTPEWLIKELGPFDIDLAATAENAVAEMYFDEEADGLKQQWIFKNGWLNPPYSKLLQWAKKLDEQMEMQNFEHLIMLTPARTDTKWFRILWDNAYRVVFLRGRLKFGNSANPAPFPSMLWYFKRIDESQPPVPKQVNVYTNELIEKIEMGPRG